MEFHPFAEGAKRQAFRRSVFAREFRTNESTLGKRVQGWAKQTSSGKHV